MTAAASTDDLCDHGCGLDATVQHADGRFLCYPCYRVEVEDADIQWRVSGSCPTCSPKPSDAAPIRGWVARLGSYLRIFGVGSQPDARYIDALTEMAKEREAEHGR